MSAPATEAPGRRRRATLDPLLAEMASRSQLTAEHPDAPGVCRSLLSSLLSMVRLSVAGR